MGYDIRAVDDASEIIAGLFSVLYSDNNWSWVDGQIAGVQTAIPNDWATVDPSTIIDGDYFVLQLPDKGSGSDSGTVRCQYRTGSPTDVVSLHAHTEGWDSGTQAPNANDIDLGTDTGALAGNPICLLNMGSDPTGELRTIVNSRRIIVILIQDTDPDTFAYLGFIQPIDTAIVDPNPLLVTAYPGPPGETTTPLLLNTDLTGAETSVVVTTTIPAGTPKRGLIEIELDSGVTRLVGYTSWATSTFTIPSTDFSSDNATAGNDVITAHPMIMEPVDSSGPISYRVNARTGLVDTDGEDILENAQWNRRDPGDPKRVGFPLLATTKRSLNTEVRGELEGVFYYGPAASLSQDTSVPRSDGTYIVIYDIVVGPVA